MKTIYFIYDDNRVSSESIVSSSLFTRSIHLDKMVAYELVFIKKSDILKKSICIKGDWLLCEVRLNKKLSRLFRKIPKERKIYFVSGKEPFTDYV